MSAKNRGENNGNAKLTAAKIVKIRQLRGRKTQAALAERFGVSIGLIGMINRREIWRHVRVPRAA